LDDSRIITWIGNHPEQTVCSVAETCIWVASSRTIEDVEHVCPELGGYTLRNTRILYDAKVLIAVTRSSGVS